MKKCGVILMLTVCLLSCFLPAAAKEIWKDVTPGEVRILSDSILSPTDECRIHLRYAGAGADSVRLVWTTESGSVAINFKKARNLGFEDEGFGPAFEISVEEKDISGQLKKLTERKFKPLKGALEQISLRITGRNGHYLLEAGDSEDFLGFEFDFSPVLYQPSKIEAIFPGIADVKRWQVKYRELDDLGYIEPEELTKLLAEQKPYGSEKYDISPGVWIYQDRDTDDMLCRLGGQYKLLSRRMPDGCFELIYLEGAVNNPSMWRPGKVKGRLSPTGFKGQYDLKWIDAFGHLAEEESYVQIESEGMLMRVSFPERSSSVRFRRIIQPSE